MSLVTLQCRTLKKNDSDMVLFHNTEGNSMSSNQHHHFGLGTDQEEQALQDLLQFPFVDALFGRRSRRFFRGAEIPDGPLAYKSRYEPLALTEGTTRSHAMHVTHLISPTIQPLLVDVPFLPQQASIRANYFLLMTVGPIFSRHVMRQHWVNAKRTARSRSLS